MTRFPSGWRGIAHPQAARATSGLLGYRPGWRGSGAQPIARVPVARYTNKVTGVPLNGGQAQGVISSGGTLTLQVGPSGMGVTWYVAQVTISTSTGLLTGLDTSVAQIYLGPAVTPSTLVASVFSGNGTAALAIPPMSPGQTLICEWSGAHPGDVAAFNLIGTQDALSTQ
jgi:hypothetical protein